MSRLYDYRQFPFVLNEACWKERCPAGGSKGLLIFILLPKTECLIKRDILTSRLKIRDSFVFNVGETERRRSQPWVMPDGSTESLQPSGDPPSKGAHGNFWERGSCSLPTKFRSEQRVDDV